MRFTDLDFIVNTEGKLEWIYAPIWTTNTISTDPIDEALQNMQLHAPKAHTPASDQHLSLDCESMEHQLGAFLGPRPALEDLQRVLHSFANVVVQLSGGEPLSPEILAKIRHGDVSIRPAQCCVGYAAVLVGCPQTSSLWA